MKKNQYFETAQYYDFLTAESGINDLDFYLNYAHEKGGKILELACGTGRISIPLARAGSPVYGIDISEAMLTIFKEKLKQEKPEIRQRIRLDQQDLSSFALDETFDLIIIPFRSFQVLKTREEQLSCLRNIKNHLQEDGHFIFNVFAATAQIEQQDPIFQREKNFEMPAGKLSIQETWSLDFAKKMISIDAKFYLSKLDGSLEEAQENHDLQYYFLPEVRSLLKESGLQLLQEYGDYDKRPIGEGREFIVVLGKA